MENLKALTEAVWLCSLVKPGILEGRVSKLCREVVENMHDYVSYVTRLPRKGCICPRKLSPKPDSLPKKGLLPIVTKRIAG